MSGQPPAAPQSEQSDAELKALPMNTDSDGAAPTDVQVAVPEPQVVVIGGEVPPPEQPHGDLPENEEPIEPVRTRLRDEQIEILSGDMPPPIYDASNVARRIALGQESLKRISSSLALTSADLEYISQEASLAAGALRVTAARPEEEKDSEDVIERVTRSMSTLNMHRLHSSQTPMNRLSRVPSLHTPSVAMAAAAAAGAAGMPSISRTGSQMRISRLTPLGPIPRPLSSVDVIPAGHTIVELPDGGVVDETTLRATFHTLDAAGAIRRLKTDHRSGLTSTDAENRLKLFGPNELKGKHGKHWFIILLQNLFSIIMILLIAAGILSFVTSDWVEGGVIFAIVIFNTALGFSQEYSSEKTLAALQQLSSTQCTVLRDGKQTQVNAQQMVPGDIVVLQGGSQIPADIRMFEVADLEVDEAVLTGEAKPVRKVTAPITDPDAELADRINMVYSGCAVLKGKGKGVVVATGMATELGKIAALVAKKGSKKNTSRLQREVRRLSLILFAVGLLCGFIVFAANRFDFTNETVIYAITVVIAVVPESLPVMLTVTLSLGVRRMAELNVIIRKLPVLETLGRVTNICSDKTGTLTQARMVAVNLWMPHRSYHITGVGLEPVGEFMVDRVTTAPDGATMAAIEIGALCNDSRIDYDEEKKQWIGHGQPTEVALVVMAKKAGVVKKELIESGKWTQLHEYSFDSALKNMVVVARNETNKATYALCKGAPEVVLRFCLALQVGEDTIPLPEGFPMLLMEVVGEMTSNGQRVIALAYRKDVSYSRGMHRDELTHEMVFVGLVGIYDPPRPESGPSVVKAHRAGITVHMLTGDHISTATCISRELGLIHPEEQPAELSMVAVEFDSMTHSQVDELVELPRVVARCLPETKVNMIEALHRRKRIVAMTGDGVNDAPALKTADVGIAMGKNGSEVTKQAADIVLKNDDFASIVVAVEEGRRIFTNIKKFIVHLITSNIATVVLLVVGLFVRDGTNHAVFPMSPLQTLTVNTLIIAIPAIGLAAEPVSADIMETPPSGGRRGVFAPDVLLDICVYGVLIGALGLSAFIFVLYGVYGGLIGVNCNSSSATDCAFVFWARATAYTTLSLLLLFNSYNCRHAYNYIWQMSFGSNWRLLGGIGIGIAVVILSVYVPVLNTVVYKQRAIGWEWAVVVVCVVLYAGLTQLYKLLKRRFMAPPTTRDFALQQMVRQRE